MTRIESETFVDTQKPRTAHPGDKDSYFPTLKTMTSYNFAPIFVDPKMRQEWHHFEEITFGLDELQIDDKFDGSDLRSTELTNVIKTREGYARNS